MSIIGPGSTIGVLGGGQLGRMFAMAARRLGYRVHTLAPDDDTPTGQIADVEINASYDDLDAIRRFARAVDVVTFEFENVPAAAAAEAETYAIVRPSGRALEIAQHRIREKTFLADRGLPVAPFAAISGEADLAKAARSVGAPAVLKTASFGYDGKGQVAIASHDDLPAAWDAIGRREAILEAFVDLDKEISVIGARGVGGAWSYFEPIENAHARHILDVSVAPALVPAATRDLAVDATRHVMEALDYVGILCIEFFVARDGRLLVNELAPRPHNSGHLTFDAARTSQFEQQLRAICGLPLGSPELLQPAAMANLLGDLWEHGEPDWAAALALPDVKLHLYGKSTPRPGRKMGHITALAGTPEAARTRVLAARAALTNSQSGAGNPTPVRTDPTLGAHSSR
jgi:5-(carboxyamino)imidazole ribonucleotide synthase